MKRKAVNVMMCTLVLSGLIMMAVGSNNGHAAGQGIPQPTKMIEGLEFKIYEIGDMIVFFHQRTIDEAIVEKDYIVYQVDKQTGRILKELKYWREDLPDKLPTDILSQEEAESKVEGVVQFSRLFYISPDSTIHKLEVTPTNPCWVVWSKNEDSGPLIISIIDAVEGEFLGYGVSPPFTAFSLTGPQEEGPCIGHWATHYQNAASWFDTMGYTTEMAIWPMESKIQSHIQSKDTAMFYEIGHSQYTPGDWFTGGCVGDSNYRATTATDIHNWMIGYTKMPFTFIASCYGMCETGPGKLSYEFRKGSLLDTATVGYCGMSDAPCDYCWLVSFSWQDNFFNYLNQGWTVKSAFDQTIADKPMCLNCILFVGDENFSVVPVVWRDLSSYFRHFLKEFRAFRRVFPPDPVIKRFLDRTEAAVDRALMWAERGDVRESFVNAHLALGMIREAGKNTDVDTAEIVESLLNAVGRKVREAIDAVGNAEKPPNYELGIAWWEYYRAMRMLESNEYNKAMQLFRVAYRLVNKYSRNGEARQNLTH